jgi:hypothetical protein
MEPEDSLLCLQESITGPYLEPDEIISPPIPHFTSFFVKNGMINC